MAMKRGEEAKYLVIQKNSPASNIRAALLSQQQHPNFQSLLHVHQATKVLTSLSCTDFAISTLHRSFIEQYENALEH